MSAFSILKIKYDFLKQIDRLDWLEIINQFATIKSRNKN